MKWNNLIAQLDERHAEDVYEFVATIISFQVVALTEQKEEYSGVGLYVSHTPDEIRIQLGRTDAATWFGKDLTITRQNVRRAEIVSTKNIVLGVLELINEHLGS